MITVVFPKWYFFYHLFFPYIIYSFIYLYHYSRILILSYGCNLLLSLFSFFCSSYLRFSHWEPFKFPPGSFSLVPIPSLFVHKCLKPSYTLPTHIQIKSLTFFFFFFNKEWYLEAETGVLGIVMDLVVYIAFRCSKGTEHR